MADQEPLKRPHVAVWKVVSVLLGLVLLTPVWIAYGCLGALLTLPSTKIMKTGLQLLATLSAWLIWQVFFVEDEGGVELRMKLQLGGCNVVLPLAQWKLDQLVLFHLNQKPEERHINTTGNAAFLIALAICVVFSWRANVEVVSQWQILSSYPMRMFWAIYALLPVIVAISHARLWVPARYSKLEHLEREIIGRNVKVPFETLKVAGLGTVRVSCTAPTAGERKIPLVLLHGYAAGYALWACNFEELAKHYDVYAIEWLGTGRSNRPKFTSYE